MCRGLKPLEDRLLCVEQEQVRTKELLKALVSGGMFAANAERAVLLSVLIGLHNLPEDVHAA